MDTIMTLAELKNTVKNFCEDRDWDQYHNAKDLAIGIVTEASELLDHFRFKSAEEVETLFKDPIKSEKISDEIADVLFFVLRFAQRYNLDLDTELHRKLSINNIKYPIEKCKGSNKKYTEE